VASIGVVGTGSLGSAIALTSHNSGHDVVSWSRTNREFPWTHFSGGFQEQPIIARLDFIVYSAGGIRPSNHSPESELVDLISFSDVIRSRNFKGHILNLSSCAVYGSASNPAIEALTPLPTTPYGVVKLGVEEFLKRTFGDSVSSLRIGNVLDLSHPKGLLKMIQESKASQSNITFYGDPLDSRDYLLAEDFGAIISALFSINNLPQILNVGSGENLSLADWEIIIQDCVPEIMNVVWKKRLKTDLQNSMLDISLLESLVDVRNQNIELKLRKFLRTSQNF
jgi:nucleoside-diphosphate-sugar epimerase